MGDIAPHPRVRAIGTYAGGQLEARVSATTPSW